MINTNHKQDILERVRAARTRAGVTDTQAKVVDFGRTTITKSPKVGLTIHASPSMHDTSVERLFKSKRYNRLPKGREVIKEGEVNSFKFVQYKYALKHGLMFLYPAEESTMVWCKPKTSKQAVTDYGKLVDIAPTIPVYIKSLFSYSFTQKTSNMATATKASKQAKLAKGKPAAKGKAKKAVSKKEGGPGKIEQIIALHKQGLSNKEIEAKGFNYTTISIQVAKWKKAHGKGKK